MPCAGEPDWLARVVTIKTKRDPVALREDLSPGAAFPIGNTRIVGDDDTTPNLEVVSSGGGTVIQATDENGDPLWRVDSAGVVQLLEDGRLRFDPDAVLNGRTGRLQTWEA